MTDQINRMVEDNINLVLFTIKKYLPTALGDDDAYQMGCMGLVKAARKYNKEKNTAFSTYAVSLIRCEILKYYRSARSKKCLINTNAISLSQTVNEGKGKKITLQEVLTDHYDVSDAVIGYFDNEALLDALNKLPLRQRKSLILYYFYEKKQSDIAKLIDCSQVTVSRELKRGIAALKVLLNAA